MPRRTDARAEGAGRLGFVGVVPHGSHPPRIVRSDDEIRLSMSYVGRLLGGRPLALIASPASGGRRVVLRYLAGRPSVLDVDALGGPVPDIDVPPSLPSGLGRDVTISGEVLPGLDGRSERLLVHCLQARGVVLPDSQSERLSLLSEAGFDVGSHVREVDVEAISDHLAWLTDASKEIDFPVEGVFYALDCHRSRSTVDRTIPGGWGVLRLVS